MTRENAVIPFQTFSDFVEYVNTTKPHSSWTGERRYSQEDKGDWEQPLSWYGTKNFQEAVKLANGGWPEGLKHITERMGLNLSIGRSKFRINDVAGDLPNVGRFLAGMPDSMTRRVIDQGMKRPVIDLILNAGFSGNIEADAIINYGAAFASLIDELEDAGFSVGLQVSSICTAGGRKIGPIINVKVPGEHLELDRLIYITAQPSFARRLNFAFREIHGTYSEIGSGYGSRAELPNEFIHEDAIYFPRNSDLNDDCSTPKKALAYVRNKIKAKRPDLFPDAEAA